MDYDAPAHGLASSLADTELTAVLQRLPARQLQVVALRIFLDLDTAQTSEVLGIAPVTVTAHLTRPSPRCAPNSRATEARGGNRE